jgi:cob(I)alamin adenosyltransferase
MPITTKTGDDGFTSSLSGKKYSKCSPEIELFGSLDELISFLGFASHELNNPELEEMEKEIQHIFTKVSRMEDIDSKLVDEIEKMIKNKEKNMPKLDKFVMPKGKSALVHICRALARKAERKAVCAYYKKGKINVAVYLNRLSDYLFLIAYEESSKRKELTFF